MEPTKELLMEPIGEDHLFEVPKAIKPRYLDGKVIKGFGRGSKMLGVPTANMDVNALTNMLEGLENGVYLGWASVNGGPVYKTVMSIGWHPFFENKELALEPYIIHKFDEDFYGADLKVIVVGRIRPERKFPSLEALIDQIHADIRLTEVALEEEQFSSFSADEFFS
eukprot:TRINITY_DN780007_c0_g1_i1.p1 TRINITY_DN780007_c0_g1~~TRINITY_DN780007_c0_g1_i1.p1  ORF type:complete len:167 (+),score=27.87 TRINITY_DN780007_c0_g1_i1:147-647(+)